MRDNFVQSTSEWSAPSDFTTSGRTPVREAMDALIEVPVSLDDAARIRKGMAVLLRGREAPLNSDVAFASHAGVPVAIGSIDKGRFQPTRVFNL